ncbi:MAG: hypothetical protein KF774_07360 [Planctomyces sp.]|nr:hypothetical protein [Planctomyces sp.]
MDSEGAFRDRERLFDAHRERDPAILKQWRAEFQATGRAKDRESLPRLIAFRDYWLERN